jgi:hypothetical protein
MVGGVIDATEAEVRMERSSDLVVVYRAEGPECCPEATTERNRALGEVARSQVVSYQWLNNVFFWCICSIG